MLDDTDAITAIDRDNMLGFIATEPAQLQHDFGVRSMSFPDISLVVFAGMGGSALAAELSRTWPHIGVPFVIVKDYALPTYVSASTLVICSSYSGNTEEALSCFDQALSSGAPLVVLTSGGELLHRAQKHGVAHVRIPECPQPRVSVLYMYRALIELLVAAKLCDPSTVTELERCVDPLTNAIGSWQASVVTKDNRAKQIAEKMLGTTPIIYAGAILAPAAYKWKISLNENAKNTAWCGTLPEFNHNEFIGWDSHPIDKPFSVFQLVSSSDHSRVQKRFSVSDRLLSGKRPAAMTIDAQGSSVLEQLLYTVLLGEYASVYLAVQNGIDPTPVHLIEVFKRELAKD